MKTLIFTIGIFLILSGCVTKKNCQRKFPPVVHEITIIEYEEKETFRDTTFYELIPGEIVVKIDTVFVSENGLVNSNVSFLETSLAWSKSQVIDSRLIHELVQIDTTLEIRLKDAIKEIDRLKEVTTIKKEITEVPRKLTKWQQFRIWIGNITLGSFGIFLLFMLLKVKLL